MILGKLPPRKIAPSSNSNANPKPNPVPDRGAIFRTPTKVASDKCFVKKVLMVVDVFGYWSTSLVEEVQLTKWAVLWGVLFWWKTILTELKTVNCQVLYLRFTEAITLNCSSFVWKGLGLRDRPVFQNKDLWHNITIPPFWEGNLSVSLQNRTHCTRNDVFHEGFPQ